MQEDTEGWDVELRYFRDIDKQEVDFVITEDEKRFNSSKDVGINLISVVRGLIFTFYSPPDLLGQANGLSVKNIAATIGLSTRTIRSRIGKLVTKGLVTVVGTGPRDPNRKFFLAGKLVTKSS
ncbi:MAG: winged helix-turn-helix transcriptional regulator [Deltaproteobacteria bacterium]|nr:winged helix-turn-helix transcriptional regulator [Deltaproteobacteria bacterium]